MISNASEDWLGRTARACRWSIDRTDETPAQTVELEECSLLGAASCQARDDRVPRAIEGFAHVDQWSAVDTGQTVEKEDVQRRFESEVLAISEPFLRPLTLRDDTDDSWVMEANWSKKISIRSSDIYSKRISRGQAEEQQLREGSSLKSRSTDDVVPFPTPWLAALRADLSNGRVDRR